MSILDRVTKYRAKRERARRAEVKRVYGAFFDEVSGLLFKADPIGINYDENTDEYDPEAGAIIPRLRHCADAEQVCGVVFDEFVRWFSAADAGAPERYQAVSEEIWAAWQRFQSERAV